LTDWRSQQTIDAMTDDAKLNDAWVRMEVKGLLIDPASETPVLLLQSASESLLLPIWIGPVEANSIAMALEGAREPRPMTHDLMHGILQGLAVELQRVEIWSLQEGTFYARLLLRHGSTTAEVDSRPSDAIAVAVRAEAPIFVARAVIQEAVQLDLATSAEEEERLREWLERARPEDLGKYTM
jgi:bifunctional DNase/RNase